MDYIKKKFVDKENRFISFFSTDDNIICSNGKTLRDNMEMINNSAEEVCDINYISPESLDEFVELTKEGGLFYCLTNISIVYNNTTYDVVGLLDTRPHSNGINYYAYNKMWQFLINPDTKAITSFSSFSEFLQKKIPSDASKLNIIDVNDNFTSENVEGALEELTTQVEENQIVLLEDDTSMEGINDTEYPTLTTQNKTLIGSINEVNAQYKDIVKNLDLVTNSEFNQVYMSETIEEQEISIGDYSWQSVSQSLNDNTLSFSRKEGTSGAFWQSIKTELINGNKYKIVLDFSNQETQYINLQGVPNQTEVTDRILISEAISGIRVIDYIPTGDNLQLNFGKISGGIADTFNVCIHIYDVTLIDDSILATIDFTKGGNIDFSSGKLFELEEEIKTLNLPPERTSVYYKDASFIFDGDSLTAPGSGQIYAVATCKALGVTSYYNTAVGGTAMEGSATGEKGSINCDDRVNKYPIEPTYNKLYIVIKCGTNGTAPLGTLSISNHDVNTFIGAYNVWFSKVYYKYKQSEGYYSDIDYSNITRSQEPIDVKIIVITPPQGWGYGQEEIEGKLKERGDAIIEMSKLWGVPCLDSRNCMFMNAFNHELYDGDSTHYGQRSHFMEANGLIGLLRMYEPINHDKNLGTLSSI